jgi:tetratricopeptide (TPR) repeat protein
MPKLAVPETLQALVAARIDANDPADRSTLADAAVLGQSFTLPGLAGVTGTDEAAVEASLDRLVKRELLIRDDDPRSPERGQYRFVQAIVREIAYETLAKKDRRAKHLAAARYFEALGEEELAGVLASHYLEAYRSTPEGPEAEALATQARIALRAAADRAASLHSLATAMKHYEDALEVTTDRAEAAHLHELAARTAGPAAHEPALRHGDAAVFAYREVGDRDGELGALGQWGRAVTSYGRASDAIAMLEPVAASPDADRPQAASALAELARAYMLVARWADAIGTADRALAAVSGRHEPRIVVEALTTKASALVDRAVEGEALLRGAIAIADRESLIEAGLRARNNLGSLLGESAPASTLLPILDEGAESARRVGMAGWLAQFLSFASTVRHWAGDWAGAEANANELEALAPGPIHAAAVHEVRGLQAAYRGDAETAEREYQEAALISEGLDTAPQLQNSQASRADSLFGLQQFPAAMNLSIQAWGHAVEYSDPMDLAVSAAVAFGDAQALDALHARRDEPGNNSTTESTLAHLDGARAAIRGAWEEARLGYRRAIEIRRELELGMIVARLGLEFDASLGAQFEDAREEGRRAEETFVSVGAGEYPGRYRAAYKGASAPPAGAGTSRRALPVDGAVETEVDAEQPA